MSEHKAQGTVIAKGDAGTPVSYTTVGKMTDFASPSRSRSSLETTDLSDLVKTFVGGLEDPGEVTFSGKLDYQDAGQNAVRSAMDDGVNYPWRVTVTDEDGNVSIIAFTGHVTSDAGASGSVDSMVDTSFTVKVSGAITITAG